MTASEPTSPASAEKTPRFSLVIPAWNEEKYLPRLLDTIDAARDVYHAGRDQIEVIVADNDSTDRTADIARSRGCTVVHVELRRIAAARNGGAGTARGEILCFVDADFQIHADTFNAIDRVMNLRYQSSKSSESGDNEGPHRFIGGGTGLKMERKSIALRFTFVCILPVLWFFRMDGGVWFCRRADFIEAGGYDESQMISEDVRFLWALKRLGKLRRPRQKLATHFDAARTGHPPALAICSTRKFDKHGDWHFIPDLVKAIFYVIFSKKGFENYARKYWYEDER